MSSKLGDTGVGELFATTPKRAAGLAGSLAPRPRLAPVPAAPADDTASVEAGPGPASTAQVEPAATRDSERRPRKAPSARASRAAKDQADSRVLIVVYVTQADLDWIGQQRKATDRTNAQITLSAIETAAPKLSGRVHPTPAASRKGMFATSTQPSSRPRERHVQLGLYGVLASDREILDQLVADTGAPSLSALVRAALEIARAGE